MSGTDTRQYAPLKNKLVNTMLLGRNNYPKTHDAALGRINHYLPKTSTKQPW